MGCTTKPSQISGGSALPVSRKLKSKDTKLKLRQESQLILSVAKPAPPKTSVLSPTPDPKARRRPSADIEKYAVRSQKRTMDESLCEKKRNDETAADDALKKRARRRAMIVCEKLSEAKALADGLESSLCLYMESHESHDYCDGRLIAQAQSVLDVLQNIEHDLNAFPKHREMKSDMNSADMRRRRIPPQSDGKSANGNSTRRGHGIKRYRSTPTKDETLRIPLKKSRRSNSKPTTSTAPTPAPGLLSLASSSAAALMIPKRHVAERYQPTNHSK